MSVQAILGSLGLVLIPCWLSNSFPLLSKVLCHRVEPQIHYMGQPLPSSLPVFLLAGPRPVALGAGDKVPAVPM